MALGPLEPVFAGSTGGEAVDGEGASTQSERSAGETQVEAVGGTAEDGIQNTRAQRAQAWLNPDIANPAMGCGPSATFPHDSFPLQVKMVTGRTLQSLQRLQIEFLQNDDVRRSLNEINGVDVERSSSVRRRSTGNAQQGEERFEQVLEQLHQADLPPVLSPLLHKLKFDPKKRIVKNFAAWHDGHIYVSLAWLQSAENDLTNIYSSLAHEGLGHGGYESLSRAVARGVAASSPESLAYVLGWQKTLLYPESEVFAELWESEFWREGAGGDSPFLDVPNKLKTMKQVFHPVVFQAAVDWLRHSVCADSRLSPDAIVRLEAALAQVGDNEL